MKHHIHNYEPKTWACNCGQINLLSDSHCFSCGEDKAAGWEPHDHEAFQRARDLEAYEHEFEVAAKRAWAIG